MISTPQIAAGLTLVLALSTSGCSWFLDAAINGKSSDPGAPQGASLEETQAAWNQALKTPRKDEMRHDNRPISDCEVERGRFREAHPERGAELPPHLQCLEDGSYPPTKPAAASPPAAP